MTSEIQEAARGYIQNGYSVIPADAKKVVKGELTPFFEKILPMERIPQKFNGAPAIGLICGKVSGNTECLDIDDVTCKDALIGMIKIKHKDILDRLVFTKTPRGFGVVYRVEPGVDIGGPQKLAWSFIEVDGPGLHNWNGRSDLLAQHYDGKWYTKACRLETRATGNYTIIAPSPGYGILEGSFENLQPIPAEDRKSILDLARTFNQWPEADEEVKPQKHSEILKKRIPTPWDVYNESIDFPILLRQAGWKKIGKVKGGTTWGRPGGVPNKISATLYDDGKLHVFSSNAAPLEIDKQYTPYAFLTYMDYDGDFQVSATKLVEAGYVPDMTVEEVTEVLKDNPDELENAYRKSGLTEAEVSVIAHQLGIEIPAGKGSNRVEILYDKTELNRVIREMDHALATIEGEWAYYKFLTQLGRVTDDNVFQVYDRQILELRAEQSFYIKSWVSRGKGKPKLERIKMPPHCTDMIMKYPNCTAPTIKGFATHPVMTDKGLIGLKDGFEDGVWFSGCSDFKIDSRPYKECYDRLIELFCDDILFADEKLGKALFVSMMLTAMARLGSMSAPGYLISANLPGTGKSTMFEIISRTVYGKLYPSAGWTTDVEELKKRLVTHLKAGTECLLFDNIKQKTTLVSEDLAQAITAGDFLGRLLGGNDEVLVPAQTLFVFIGNDIKMANELTRRIMTVQLEAKKANPERRAVGVKKIETYCLENRNEAVGCLLKMLQEGVKMDNKLKHTSGMEFWDRVVRNPLMVELDVDISEGFDISSQGSDENQGVGAVVTLLNDVFGPGVPFLSKDVYLAIAARLDDDEIKPAAVIRGLKEDSCRDLRDALADLNKQAPFSSASTGRALSKLSDHQISGNLRFVRNETKSHKPVQHWIEVIE